MRPTPKVLGAALVWLVGCAATDVRADLVIYSNTTNFTGLAYAPGGAAADGAGGSSTAMAADDITVAAGNGGASVTSLAFSVANLNSVSTSANVDLRFYTVGTNGGPGTLIGALNFNPLTVAAGTDEVAVYAPGTPLFTVPTSGQFFVGEFFTNDSSTATATTAQLNNLALGIYNPPTVGSSSDSFFKTTAGGSKNLTSNPSGGFLSFNGSPAANFGFAFSTPTPTPEPGAFVLIASGLGTLAFARWRRQT